MATEGEAPRLLAADELAAVREAVAGWGEWEQLDVPWAMHRAHQLFSHIAALEEMAAEWGQVRAQNADLRNFIQAQDGRIAAQEARIGALEAVALTGREFERSVDIHLNASSGKRSAALDVDARQRLHDALDALEAAHGD